MCVLFHSSWFTWLVGQSLGHGSRRGLADKVRVSVSVPATRPPEVTGPVKTTKTQHTTRRG